MTKDELITKQQIEIEEMKQMLRQNHLIKRDLFRRFYSIGQPLNDNVLQFNKDQMVWCFGVVELIEAINTVKP